MEEEKQIFTFFIGAGVVHIEASSKDEAEIKIREIYPGLEPELAEIA
jgi:hypothetical protein